ncbi:MAG: biotin--[acetyl-CoA-carboxylase] ligase [Bacteroidota bacterium]
MDYRIEWFKSVSSTNDICQQRANMGVAEGVVIAAEFQEQGRGQRGNAWESQAGLNLTFSMLLRPTFLPVGEQFYLSKAIALAITDWLKAYVENKPVKIKWPNDIYIGNSKICGILIENSFSGQNLETSVVGIGVNLNQINFPDDLPNPTSLLLETGKKVTPQDALPEVISCIGARYLQLVESNRVAIDNDYLNAIYRKDQLCKYYSNGEEFEATITGIHPTGELILKTSNGEIRTFAFKEVTFII